MAPARASAYNNRRRQASDFPRPGPRRLSTVRITRLRKSYGPEPVLYDLSLDIPAGKLVALLGESGAGKTTVLRAVAGLCAPDAGEVRFGDRRVDGTPPERRGVGIVFQDLALFPHMRVWENVAFPLEGRLGKAERRARAVETLRSVRLERGHDAYPHEISGGEKRRVALARALAGEPEVLLLDEPFSDMQRALRDELLELVWGLARERGVPVLHATHLQEEALGFSDVVAVLHGGRIVQVGPPEEVYRRPTTPEVARLLGEMNVLTGRRVAPGIIETALGRIETNGGADEVRLGLRPEAVRLGAAGTAQGEVRRRRFEGGRTLYEIALGDERIWAVGDGDHEAGERVALRFDPEAVVMFSESNGLGEKE